MLVPIRFMLDHARSNGYGFLRVVVSNLEETQAAMAAAEEANSPMALAVNEPEGHFPRYLSFEAMVIAAAAKCDLPIGVQFDHTQDMTLILRAVRGGYNGIMIDAANRPFKQNVALTNKVIDICRPLGISVEGEVGAITRTWDNPTEKEQHELTEPDAAREYVKQTKVDALAIAIGEVSGFSSGDIDFKRLKQIKKAVGDKTHLCLHGVSFITDAEIRKILEGGITYYGCATEFRYAFFQKLDEVRKKEGPKMVDPTLLYTPARQAMTDSVVKKLKLLGSAGKAGKVLKSYLARY